MRWERAEQVSRLDEHFDVLVVGGGVVGAGIALDAATRGLKVALVERTDFAAGTSSRSTKLLHGGVRYLAQMRLGLVRRGLAEQRVLAFIADHLVTPFDFVIPVYRNRRFADAPRWARNRFIFPIALRLGLWIYDRLGGWRTGKRKLSRQEMLARFPKLKPDGLRYGLVYTDAQTDDARLTITILKTAVTRFGAVAANWLHAESIERGESAFHTTVRDRLTGEVRRVRSQTVVSATGTHPPPPGVGDDPLELVLSKGVHLIAGKSDLALGDQALVLPETTDRRVMFLVPWLDHVVVGTTDTPYDGDRAHPEATAEDIAYLLEHVYDYLAVDDIEVKAAWAGLRALATGEGSTAQLSREHIVAELAPGFVQVAGGKLTGYREIASEVADIVARHVGSAAKSITEHVPLVGSGVDDVLRRRLEGRATDKYLDMVIERYGTQAVEVLALSEESGSTLAHEVGGSRWRLAEAMFAARYECAATISDVILRRTRLAWLTDDHARSTFSSLGTVLAGELGWNDARLDDELERAERALRAEGL